MLLFYGSYDKELAEVRKHPHGRGEDLQQNVQALGRLRNTPTDVGKT